MFTVVQYELASHVMRPYGERVVARYVWKKIFFFFRITIQGKKDYLEGSKQFLGFFAVIYRINRIIQKVLKTF